MTEENIEAIEVAPQQAEDVVADNESEQPEAVESEDSQEYSEQQEGDVEFPKKAKNVIRRKNKEISKLRSKMRELQALQEELASQKTEAPKELNPDDYETYQEYFDAQVNSAVEKKVGQSQADMQQQYIDQQKQALQQEQYQHIVSQAQEAAKVLPDLPQVMQQHQVLLDNLPPELEDIFCSLDHAPAAIYTLAKEGQLESLLYANQYVAAQRIIDAERRGLEKISQPQVRHSQAPQPISKARGTGTVKKQLSTESDVLASLRKNNLL